jgi:L-rhamnose mutarotase
MYRRDPLYDSRERYAIHLQEQEKLIFEPFEGMNARAAARADLTDEIAQ